MKRTALLLVILLLIIPAAAFAAEPSPAGPAQAEQNKQLTEIKVTTGDISKIKGDILVKENEKIIGNLATVKGDIIVYGQVQGDLTCVKGDIIIKKSGRVDGNTTVISGEIVREPGSVVTGTVVQGARKSDTQVYETPFPERAFKSFTTMLGLLAVIAIIIAIFPHNLQKMLGALNLEPGRVVLVGFLGWLLLPFAMLFSLITLVGPLILGIGAMITVLVGVVIVSSLLGEKIRELLKWQTDNKITTALIGLFALWLASLLQATMIFIVPMCAVIGMGVVLVSKFGTGRPWLPARKANVTVNPVDTKTGGEANEDTHKEK